LPTRYLRAFDEIQADPEYVSLRKQIGVIYARESELLERIGDHAPKWEEARALLDEIAGSSDADSAEAALDALVALVDRGCKQAATFSELYGVLEVHRRLADTERRRIESANAYMTADELAIAAGFFANILRRYVRDPGDLRAAAAEMGAFFDSARTPASGVAASRIANRREDRLERERLAREQDAAAVGEVDAAEVDAEVVDVEEV